MWNNRTPDARFLFRSGLVSIADTRQLAQLPSYGIEPPIQDPANHSRMIRGGRFKYPVYDSGTSREDLVDLENEPGEMANLASDPVRQDNLRSHWKSLAQRYQENDEQLDANHLVR